MRLKSHLGALARRLCPVRFPSHRVGAAGRGFLVYTVVIEDEVGLGANTQSFSHLKIKYYFANIKVAACTLILILLASDL
jgi:hypothetical protein